MEKETLKQIVSPMKNQEGSVLVYSLIVLVLLTILGISSMTTTLTEQKISQNHMCYTLSLYAAEAAREFVPPNTQLYHTDNITVGAGIEFPRNDGLDNDGDGNIDDAGETLVIVNSTQSFHGSVGYNASSLPPLGSGYDVDTFRAHKYTIAATGYGPRNTRRSIKAGFYRIGF